MRERLPAARRLARRGLRDLGAAVLVLTGRRLDLATELVEPGRQLSPWEIEQRREAYRASWEVAQRDAADPEMMETLRSAVKALDERQARSTAPSA